MKLVATIKKRHDIDIISKVKELQSLGIMNYRINYAKIHTKEEEFDFFETVNHISDIDSKIGVMVDIPYPGKKIRLLYKDRSTQVNRGDEYILNLTRSSKTILHEDEIFLNEDVNGKQIFEGMILKYDMGEGAFVVCDKLSASKFVIKAKNSFKMCSNKGLAFGNVIKQSYIEIVTKINNNVNNIESYAFSFIESGEDIEEMMELKNTYREVSFISKIETQKGIENLEVITKNSDAVMLGRGDLCLNSPVGNLMKYERIVAEACIANRCKYYIASGFLNSFMKGYLPSHSDIIDISYAISLKPDYLVLNTDLILSERMEDVVNLIKEISN